MEILILFIFSLISSSLCAPTTSKLHVVCKSDKDCELDGNINISPDYMREGDILEGTLEARNALRSKTRLWKNGIIPYVFHKKIAPASRVKIQNAMSALEMQTCVKFVPYEESMGEHYLMVLANAGCFATVGFKKSEQSYLNLNERGCLYYLGTMQHELLHVLGIEHEQSRPDRDDYVTILEENIEDGMKKQFKKVSDSEFSTFDIPYDYKSVMHYSAYSFSKNRKATLLPKDSSIDPESLGQRDGASKLDIKKINILYNCNK